ncbi:3-phenylpropionate/trans-cinnamate dioxygenase ferredoxin reductase subunit [Saccharopolyspora antimicrobica]|uniref:3-phenylpropionate/trans-cinnamate dioxygenase ferredoxin reductase subunit n=1 Tax=Saccharopolyspora antimicrobica TaxID=455193 RepID=A0A1I4VI13_9PSEU|nr:FAD-dependent oxidoreductase [Saccharopolyspora antimicrobica]RKT86319.1 3-phenylpropionate/trans-cinnamate dioxygenase ferredoxin reductase subunit [Saccharopolyspora antimicrobica]SFN00821.1 3-phenylpropionate/trans-cinnamate dioxygenase ferredoxin reductase subunit [Saccharopolyspora antimicrobica]
MRAVAVVGASVAGWRAAQELREQGFDGQLVIIGAEPHRPYDRPPLSKEFLAGKLQPEELALGSEQEEADLAAEWRLGVAAVRLDTRRGAVVLADGSEVRVDGVVLATGSARLSLPGGGEVPGCHRMRTIDDALALREDISAGARVVVVGGGLIGTEIASSCRALGAQVTLVDAQHLPLARTLGIELAPLYFALHEDHGVRVRCGTPAIRVLAEDRVTGVELADGRVLPADAVVVEVGAEPATHWLRGSGLKLRDGVVTDSGCATAIPNVVAVGDIARYRPPHHRRTVRSDHWSTAMNQPPVAVRNLLAGRTVADYTGIPHFWSRQYGSTLQFAGYAGPKDRITVVDGSLASRRFVAAYHRGGRQVAVLAMNSPKQFATHRRRLTTTLTAVTNRGEGHL